MKTTIDTFQCPACECFSPSEQELAQREENVGTKEGLQQFRKEISPEMTIETIVSFVTAAALLALAPGPDNIFVLTQSALNGRMAGFSTILGLCTGLIFHSCAVAIGVAAIFKTSPVAFSVLKCAGAAYLIYLASQLLKAGKQSVTDKESRRVDYLALYKKGVIMNVTNPKVSLFFLAFLPPVYEPSMGKHSRANPYTGRPLHCFSVCRLRSYCNPGRDHWKLAQYIKNSSAGSEQDWSSCVHPAGNKPCNGRAISIQMFRANSRETLRKTVRLRYFFKSRSSMFVYSTGPPA